LGTLSGTHGCSTGAEAGSESGEPARFVFEDGLAAALPLTETETLAATDTLWVTDTLLITGTLPELEAEVLEVLTVTLPISESLDVVALTDTVEITVTGVVSGTLFLVVETAVEEEMLLETLAVAGSEQWSHELTIVYSYDPLQRLAEASYSDGRSFVYEYDAVGNRMSETADLGPGNPLPTVNYTYDPANRLIQVGAISYDWDDNGNLLDDGAYTYTYSQANRLSTITGASFSASMAYNGHGDRVSQTVNGQTTTYTLDLASGLTQVLADSAGNTYLYGLGRIGEQQTGGWQYHLADALGSVRQLAGSTGSATLARTYEPYGEVLSSMGSASTAFGYTGEQTDASGLVYLRARYYSPYLNQFIQRDPIVSDPYRALGWNRYAYSWDNPINFTDPSGHVPYNRYAAADYARRWALGVNPQYGEFGDSDCTNFVSQALKAGGFPEDDRWFFDRTYNSHPGRCTGYRYPTPFPRCGGFCGEDDRWMYAVQVYLDQAHSAFCGNSWALTDNLFDYLTKTKGFRSTVLEDATGLPQGPKYIAFTSEVRTGDVVFYHQEGTDSVAAGGRFNHAAFVVGWGYTTKEGEPSYIVGDPEGEPPPIIPNVVDHSAQYSMYGPRAINDTYGPVQQMVIVHIPDVIPTLGRYKPGCGK